MTSELNLGQMLTISWRFVLPPFPPCSVRWYVGLPLKKIALKRIFLNCLCHAGCFTYFFMLNKRLWMLTLRFWPEEQGWLQSKQIIIFFCNLRNVLQHAFLLLWTLEQKQPPKKTNLKCYFVGRLLFEEVYMQTFRSFPIYFFSLPLTHSFIRFLPFLSLLRVSHWIKISVLTVLSCLAETSGPVVTFCLAS